MPVTTDPRAAGLADDKCQCGSSTHLAPLTGNEEPRS